MMSIFMPLLASAILISPQPLPSLQSTTNASSSFLTNRVAPEDKVVDYLANEGFLLSIKAPKLKKPADSENKRKNQYKETLHAAEPTIIQVQNNHPQSSYEETYMAAGAQYGIPWQILYGLHMTETGGRNGPIMNGQGSGAQGPMQFMPGTWGAYGVDGDGDGNADINNAVDAIHGAANYLAKHGALDEGLRAYGGNYSGTLQHAQAKGFTALE